MPDGAGKGVIHGIPMSMSMELIRETLDCDANPPILGVRRLGDSGSLLILFEGSEVPWRVKCLGSFKKCWLYKKKLEVCVTCGLLGHRADVCPDPKKLKCRGCGKENPEQGHTCIPVCQLCGGAHMLGDSKCRKMYRKPFVATKDATRREDGKDGAAQAKDGPKGRSRSGTPSRSESGARLTDKKEFPSLPSREDPRLPKTGPEKAVSFASKVTKANPETVALRKENAELKAKIGKQEAELKRQGTEIAELRKMIAELVNNKATSVAPPTQAAAQKLPEAKPEIEEADEKMDTEVVRPTSIKRKAAETDPLVTLERKLTSKFGSKIDRLETQMQEVNVRLNALGDIKGSMDKILAALSGLTERMANMESVVFANNGQESQ
ncbi:hypothetical protein V5799_005434 [Amblyomma americanum]|uniref:CCHC-type domain-containing protein n=1 Tax=Amblyomma americanum TaxID=6943 RepID=A0AAQ4DZ95_AMBAM